MDIVDLDLKVHGELRGIWNSHMATSDKTKTKDYAAIMAEIEAAPQDEPAPRTVTRIIDLICAAQLTPTEMDLLLRAVQKKTGAGLTALRKQLKAALGALKDDNPEYTAVQIGQMFVERFYTQEGLRTLQHQGATFYDWQGTHYTQFETEEVRAALYRFMTDLECDPNRKGVGDAMEALAAEAQLTRVKAPGWINTKGANPRELIAYQNGLLHLPTRELLPHTPQFYNWTALPFPHDAAAPPPTLWLEFLEQLWPNDPASIATLQEIFGLCISLETKFQKIFMLLGPPRSGKGTIIRVLRGLIGAENCAGPTLSQLATNFGLSSLIGKQLAIISDARLGRVDPAVVVERLLSVSGEDAIDIDRKYRDHHRDPLWARILIATNELPMFRDISGAIVSRLVVLTLHESFLGREDLGLTDKLLVELPGINNWALEGYDRLMERGYFVQPQPGMAALRELEDMASPIKAFVRECCLVGPQHSIQVSRLFDAWREWCQSQNLREVWMVNNFGRSLRSVVTTVKDFRPSGEPRQYVGIGIRG